MLIQQESSPNMPRSKKSATSLISSSIDLIEVKCLTTLTIKSDRRPDLSSKSMAIAETGICMIYVQYRDAYQLSHTIQNNIQWSKA